MAAVSMMAYPARDSYAGYPQQYQLYQTRAHQPQTQVGATISTNPYAGFAPPTQQLPHPPVQPQAVPAQRQPNSSRSSNSPVSEDGNRPSLPSISNLLGIADGDRPGEAQASHQAAQAQMAQQQKQQQQQQAMIAEQRHRHAHPAPELSNCQRTTIPPTPPLRNDSVVDNAQSPSTVSTGSSLPTQPYYVGSALNNMEAEQQKVAHVNFLKRHSVPTQPTNSPYTTSPYGSSPGGLLNGSYYSPSDPSYPVSNLYHQRPLPSNFPPQPSMPVQPSSHPQGLPAPNPWEHHHYISPSSQATFPQSQDRYICQTCNKAFSRPSSLKIHSHSHTGEKPFKCPHAGCGKAFSVRSNMKRHERGCHTGGGPVGGHAQFV